ncbi:unnamed protein product [Trichobilharzia szidati]|nr:unnamed protein product [Trichobilharzia szidati]
MTSILQKLHNAFYQKTKPTTMKLGFLLASPLVAGSGLLFWYVKYGRSKQEADDSFKDPEFTGFTLTHFPVCKPDSISESAGYFVLPKDIAKMAEEAKLKLSGHWHPNDVIVASYPKSGTTWLSEAVFLIVNKLNWVKAYSKNLEERVPYLEYIWPGPSTIARTPAPRVIKTHLPFYLLPEEIQRGECARVIYIVRDPRDVVVSYYHFARCFTPAGYQNLEGLNGFVNRFLNDKLPYSPWCEHVKSYSEAASSKFVDKREKDALKPKVLLITYEMFKSNSQATLKLIEEFIHETWIDNASDCLSRPKRLTTSQIAELAEHCSFENMSRNRTTNFEWMKEIGLWSTEEGTRFMRRGQIGDYQTTLTTSQVEQIVHKVNKAGLQWTLAKNLST